MTGVEGDSVEGEGEDEGEGEGEGEVEVARQRRVLRDNEATVRGRRGSRAAVERALAGRVSRSEHNGLKASLRSFRPAARASIMFGERND